MSQKHLHKEACPAGVGGKQMPWPSAKEIQAKTVSEGFMELVYVQPSFQRRKRKVLSSLWASSSPSVPEGNVVILRFWLVLTWYASCSTNYLSLHDFSVLGSRLRALHTSSHLILKQPKEGANIAIPVLKMKQQPGEAIYLRSHS